MGVVRVSPKLIVCESWHLCKWEDISPLLGLTDTDVSDIIKGKFMSLRGKGSTLGAWKFSSGKVPGVKVHASISCAAAKI